MVQKKSTDKQQRFKSDSTPNIFLSQQVPTISAIVPVYNEEKTVAKVINTLVTCPLIDEVICVNDGSSDKSLAVLKSFQNKIKLINFAQNQGKGKALAEGVKQANNEIVCFIDADLVSLTHEHLKTLLTPILHEDYRVVLGNPIRGIISNAFASLTGERAYYKQDLLPHLEAMSDTRFGVEIFLNDIFSESVTKKVPLKQLRDLYKYEKRNFSEAFKEYLLEAVEIAQEIGRREGLGREDKRALLQIVQASNLKELQLRIKAVTNKNIKLFFENYILRYFENVQKWKAMFK